MNTARVAPGANVASDDARAPPHAEGREKAGPREQSNGVGAKTSWSSSSVSKQLHEGMAAMAAAEHSRRPAGAGGMEDIAPFPDPMPVLVGLGVVTEHSEHWGHGLSIYTTVFSNWATSASDPAILAADYTVTTLEQPPDAPQRFKDKIGQSYVQRRFFRVDRQSKCFELIGGRDMPAESDYFELDRAYSIDGKNEEPAFPWIQVHANAGGWSFFSENGKRQYQYAFNSANTVLQSVNAVDGDGNLLAPEAWTRTFFIAAGPGYTADKKAHVVAPLLRKPDPVEGQLAALRTYFSGTTFRADTDPIVVRVRAELGSVTRIDTADARFAAAGAFAFEFQLSKAELVEYVAAGSPPDWRLSGSAFATPELANSAPVSNDSSPAELAFGPVKVEPGPDGRVVARYTAGFLGDFTELYELESYPFDVQPLKVALRFRRETGRDVRYVVAEQPGGLGLLKSTEWHEVRAPRLAVEFVEDADDADPGNAAAAGFFEVTLKVVVQRYYAVMLYRIVAVMAAFSLATLYAFVIPTEDIGDRLAHAVTLMLTATAYSIVVSDSLPKLGYLTWLEKYILETLLFMFVIITELAAIEHFELSGDVEEAIALADLGAFVLGHLVLVAHVRCSVLTKEAAKSDL